VFGTILQTAADSIEVTWNLMPGYGGGFKLDKPEDNYFTNSLFYHYQLAGTFGPGNAGTRVFFAGDSVGHLGGWVEGAAMSAINAVVGVCSMVAHSGASLEFRDASVQFLLDPASNLFHQYKFLGGHEPEVTGLLEMHRLGSCSGDPRCPPSSWVFNGEVPTAAADDSFPSVSVSSDGNYAAVARRAGGVWLQRRDAVNGWQAPIQIPGITSIALPIALDSLPLVNGTSSQLQLLFIDGNSRNLFHGIRGADNTWSAFRSPWSNTASDCDIALDGQALQVVVKDSQGYLRHGIRFPDGSWSPLNYPPAPGGGYFLVQSVSIGCTSLNVDIATIAVTDNNGAVWVAMRFGKQPDGPWSPWEMLPAPAGVTAQATEVAVVVLDDDNQAQLVAAFGNDAVYTSTRYSTNGPSEGEWTAFRRVPYPIGGTGRVARDLCVTRLNGPCDPTFSTAIFADVYAA
jgi:hypothetical protein